MQAGHQDHRRRLGGEVDVGDAFAHRRGELAVDDADQRLARRERAHHLGAERLVLDAGDEVAHHRQRDVGLEQGHAHFAQHVLDVVFGDAGLAAHRLDEAAEPFGEVGSHGRGDCAFALGGTRKYTLPMILSFGPSSESTPATALAMGVPSLVALLCYAVAALPGERFAHALRVALLLGWLAQGVAIVVDIAGIGAAVPGARFGFAPALSVTLWLVLAVYGLESRFVPLPGARRALALLGVVVVVLAWAFPGQLHPQAASKWAPLHWLLGIASYGLFGVAVLHAVMLNRAERQLRHTPAAAATLAGACRCCASSA